MTTQLETLAQVGRALGALTGAAQMVGTSSAAEVNQIAAMVRSSLEYVHIDDLRLVDALARLEVLEEKLLAYARANEVEL